jgi:molecular chaperone GrpE
MTMSDEREAGREPLIPEAAEPPGELETLARERDQYKDLLLRSTAEFDNFRKRVERERRETIEQANADLIRELLPLIDDLERAAGTETGDSVEAFRRGVGLIGKRFADILAARGVVALDPVGAPFDPHEHEAVMREAREGVAEGEVLEVLSRGYKLKDRLLRPAVVKVAA